MQPNTPITPSKELPKKLPTPKMIIAITALILFGSGYCFSQSHKTGQTMNTNIKQEARIAALEKRIAEAGDDFVSLTAEEYDLLLSQPIGTVDGFEPLTTTAGGIMVGIGFDNRPRMSSYPKIYKTDIQTIFPKIPNVGEGEVFVIFDFVKGTNGLDFLDRMSNTEIKENEFTQLALDIRTAGSKSYWFGSRYVHLQDPKDDIAIRALGALGGEVEVSAVSGKVVMHLPTNITGPALAKGDIGVEKPFAGGVITLKEIKDGNISFQFTGDSKKIYAWTVYDDTNTILDIKEVLLNDGLYQLYAEHPQSVKVYQAEIVRKEYPFAFGNESHATSEGVSSVQEQKPAPSVQTSGAVDTTINNIQTNNVAPVYLDKNDPIFISIKGRAVIDLKQSIKKSDPESPENKLIATQMKAWSQEKQNQLPALFEKSINDYTAQTHFDVETFLLVFSVLGKMDQKEIAKEYDIRVQYFGGNKCVAEFWEDGLAVNSEAHALATRYPDDREIVKDAKETYANVRKSIEDGKQERYYKAMVLLYTLEKDGSITFHNPFQPVIDFK